MSMDQIQCVFVGDQHVGKTSLIFNILHIQIDENNPSVGPCFHRTTLQQFGNSIDLSIFDTFPCTGRFASILPIHLRPPKIAVLIFSIDNHESFECIQNVYSQLIHGTLPVIIVGNKCDLEDQRQVTKKEAKEYADEIGALYFETSSVSGKNTTSVLNSILKIYVLFSDSQ